MKGRGRASTDMVFIDPLAFTIFDWVFCEHSAVVVFLKMKPALRAGEGAGEMVQWLERETWISQFSASRSGNSQLPEIPGPGEINSDSKDTFTHVHV